MFTHLWIKIILFELLLKFISLEILPEKNDTDNQEVDLPPIKVSHNIIDQETVYGKYPRISNCFIDFSQYKMYIIDKNRIFHKDGNIMLIYFGIILKILHLNAMKEMILKLNAQP